MYGHGNRSISVDEALEEECPLCLVPIGEWCVYVAPKEKLNPAREYALVTRMGMQRAGTRSKTLHTPRFNLAREKFDLPPSRSSRLLSRPSAVAVAARVAWRRWDLDEYVAMQAWLRENSDIFRLDKGR